jgi:hypothetical protein
MDDTPVSTAELPATPVRDRNIPATAWREAPAALLALSPVAEYKRRIGPWLLWRSGPATGDHATYMAVLADDLAVQRTFRLFPDGTGDDGDGRTRFRAWKEHLLGR